ncbi:hypothetical protein FE257_003730 [Aspergillus nanangensis]|uniref:Uncharacterized protein n=1 Tax=Aspergillus nanangensis TaxID=2582783 RepID=A0AAD4GXM1_ASPNN|nr:hypothetical protein FE257_003730 [Aspergillus nanangensis]
METMRNLFFKSPSPSSPENLTPPSSSSSPPHPHQDTTTPTTTSPSTPTTPTNPTRTPHLKVPDLLSDSEISVLDLGPTMDNNDGMMSGARNAMDNRSADRPIPEVRISPPESEASTVKPSKSGRSGEGEQQEEEKKHAAAGEDTPRLSKGVAVGGKRARGGVAKAFRTISSPLMGPLKGGSAASDNRPGVHRARTSFWRGKD